MKHTAQVAVIVTLLAASALGCKSASKYAWWKKDQAGESTALAHSAPQLPSDLAKQNESPSSSAQLVGGTAAPFVPSQASKSPLAATASSGAYPSTSAPAFNSSTSRAGSTSALAGQGPSSANLGSIAMPYNPTAAPAPKSVGASVAAATNPAERYGSAGLGSVGSSPSSTMPYGQAASGAAPAFNAAASTAANSMAGAANTAGSFPSRYSSGLSDAPAAAQSAATQTTLPSAVSPSPAPQIAPYTPRYGAAVDSSAVAATTPTPAAAATPTTPQTVKPATAVVAVQPYRPGGTSTYSGSATLPATAQSPVQVASRPEQTATTTPKPAAPTITPNIALPSAATPTTQPATTSRYW
jgi:hypothetical protein